MFYENAFPRQESIKTEKLFQKIEEKRGQEKIADYQLVNEEKIEKKKLRGKVSKLKGK